MIRLLISLVLAGALGACATTGDGASDQSLDAGPSTDAGTSAPADASADASGAAGTTTGEPSAACAEAFGPLAELGLQSTSDLGDLAEVEATVERCESIADWMAGAQQVVEGEITPGGADLLLRIRCDDPSLSGSPICEELAGS
jgi:hypothetical protein